MTLLRQRHQHRSLTLGVNHPSSIPGRVSFRMNSEDRWGATSNADLLGRPLRVCLHRFAAAESAVATASESRSTPLHAEVYEVRAQCLSPRDGVRDVDGRDPV